MERSKNGCNIAPMKPKKKTRESGSVKIDKEVYQEAAELCDSQGWRIFSFVTKAVAEKVAAEKERLNVK